jgi:hypothetical protein
MSGADHTHLRVVLDDGRRETGWEKYHVRSDQTMRFLVSEFGLASPNTLEAVYINLSKMVARLGLQLRRLFCEVHALIGNGVEK